MPGRRVLAVDAPRVGDDVDLVGVDHVLERVIERRVRVVGSGVDDVGVRRDRMHPLDVE
jgi:hypothetical protein